MMKDSMLRLGTRHRYLLLQLLADMYTEGPSQCNKAKKKEIKSTKIEKKDVNCLYVLTT